VQIPADTVVEVRYQTYEVPADPLHESQALQMEIAQGITSPVDVVADRDGITRQSAYDKIKRNLQESRDLGVLPPEQMPTPDTVPQ
jgi:capsid protein